MSLRTPPDQDIVLVGATGDLAARKLLPALYNLELEGLLPTSGDLIGVAPMAWDDARFRAHAEQALSAGATREEIIEAVLTPLPVAGINGVIECLPVVLDAGK